MTQKYEPVEWTDETPTQPGTLINKARLDQMQSAHHYADGFEEVDAIPTEDPGTDYHKVVYCTADSTFYRWDGDEWTADIDDDTKRLLLEHEANHSNPHAVTKAQVGLGNVDNTSDTNKPVSTAQAAAIGLVESYLDAHEANHSNPHAVTKAQVGLGNADNTADLDKPISTAVQTALNGKVGTTGDQSISGSKTFMADANNIFLLKGATELGAEVNIGSEATGSDPLGQITFIKLPTLVTVATIESDAAGLLTLTGATAVTIHDQRAYNASNTEDVATIGTLDAYTPMVRTVNAQTIGGIKTFTDGIVAFAQGWNRVDSTATAQGKYNQFLKLKGGYAGMYTIIEFIQASNTAQCYGRLLVHHNVNIHSSVWIERAGTGSNNPLSRTSIQVATDGTDIFVFWRQENPYGTLIARAYTSVNYGAIRPAEADTVQFYSPRSSITTYDDLTSFSYSWTPVENNGESIGTDTTPIKLVNGVPTAVSAALAVDSAVVHTSGDETINNKKTFAGQIWANNTVRLDPNTDIRRGIVILDSVNHAEQYLFGQNTNAGNLRISYVPNGASLMEWSNAGVVTAPNQRAYDPANTTDVATIGTLDQYSPMVRTANAQTISGNKTFNDHILASTSVQNVPAVMPRATGTGWVKLYETADTNHANAILAMLPRRATSSPGFGILAVGGHNNGTVICKWMAKDLVNTNYLDKVMVTIETDVITVWGANISATDNINMRIIADVFNGSYMLTNAGFKAATDTAIYTMTTDGGGNITGYTDSDSVVHTFIAYEISS